MDLGLQLLVDDKNYSNVNCTPPNCTCSSTDPASIISVEGMPQSVLLRFDDAVDIANVPIDPEFLGNLRWRHKANEYAIAHPQLRVLNYPSRNLNSVCTITFSPLAQSHTGVTACVTLYGTAIFEHVYGSATALTK